ncbi:MAG TPA: hypothetical protein VMQ51_00490, partial [Candidatus Binatia bacterium]|nr:hypothetical protein [Candidatus Binatia bacterium]
GLDTKLAAQDLLAGPVLALCLPQVTKAHGEAHQRAVDDLLEGLELEEADAALNGALGRPGSAMEVPELGEHLDREIVKPLALAAEPLLEPLLDVPSRARRSNSTTSMTTPVASSRTASASLLTLTDVGCGRHSRSTKRVWRKPNLKRWSH